MSKSFRYVEDFSFPSDFGFSQSSRATGGPQDQPLTRAKQGLEYGPGGDNDAGAGDVAHLARGGMPRSRLPKAPVAKAPSMAKAPRRPAMARPPGPAPAASPLAMAMGAPGTPSNAPMSMAPSPEQQMARGGSMQRRGFSEGGADRQDDSRATPPRPSSPRSSMSAPSSDYAGESERGRFGAGMPGAPAAATPKKRMAAPGRPLPRPPAYEKPPAPPEPPMRRTLPSAYMGDTAVGGTAGNYAEGGHLSMKQRKALPSSDFALPGKGAGPSGKGSGSYPIPDASHARNALARVSQHGSPGEKAKVRAAVHRKFPGIGKADGGMVSDDADGPDGSNLDGFARGGSMRTLTSRQGFFNGGHAKMHEKFGFTGSLEGRTNRAAGGFMKTDDAALGSYPEEKTSMPRQMQANTPAMAKGGRACRADGGAADADIKVRRPDGSRDFQKEGAIMTDNEMSKFMRNRMLAGKRPMSNFVYPDDGPFSLMEKTAATEAQHIDPRGERGGFAKGGSAKHPDEAQDRALIKRMMAEHEKAEGEPTKMARGGHARLPAGMKATALQRHSPINTPPRNPMRTKTPRNIAPGGQMAYGVQPSAEADPAGSKQGIPQLARGGRVKAGCY